MLPKYSLTITTHHLVSMLLLFLSLSFSQVSAAQARTSDSLDNMAEENYVFESEHERKSYQSLVEELRCPKCQNQNIADSDAMIAHDMRRKVYELIQQGKSREDVITYMKTRYGDFVSYAPPINVATMWLWLLPILFAVIMLSIFMFRRPKEVAQHKQSTLAEAEALLMGEEAVTNELTQSERSPIRPDNADPENSERIHSRRDTSR